ncbi:MAG: hypothetical protein CFE21_06250 [Bacteroidetes bacterium B1(2017)]|nr:MAG: hypothetical protein CFE21_06250 [Bacteroidetes bacterium B1(2017)]
MLKNYTKLHWVIFIVVFTIVGFRALNISVFNYERARNGLMGDGFSDKNTLSSANYFLDSGFSKTSYLPVHDYFPADTSYHQVVYTHYPALPNILAGFYGVIFQSKSEQVLRIIPILLACFFFFFIYYVLLKWVKDPKKATIGALTLWLANYFIGYADNLHQHLYGEFLKWIYAYGLYVYYESNRQQKGIWIGLLLIMVAEVNISFEQPVYLGILTLGFSLIYQKKVFSFETISAAAMVVLGFALHLLQNAHYFGSWQLAVDDMTKAYTFRATGTETIGYIKEKEFTWKNFPEIPFDWFNRMERFYVFPGWAMLVVFMLSYKQFKQNYPRLFQINWALFFAAITWSFIMSQHAYVHAFTNKHFALCYALTASICLPIYWQKVKTAFQHKEILPKVLHIILIGYALAMFLSQQVWEVWLKFGILFPKFGR